MQHEVVPSELPRAAFDMAGFARSVVVAGIMAAEDDKGVMKERIMLARECGFFDDAETRQWVVDYGLEAA